MSRIGKKPVAIPSGVNVNLNGSELTIEKSGKSQTLNCRPEVSLSWDEGARTVSVSVADGFDGDRFARAMWGTTRALIENMVVGVDKGYEKRLEINGAGWGATVQGPILELKVGYANPIRLNIPQGLDINVERNIVSVKGACKQTVGQFASEIRATRKPEPYNGKGVKYVDETIKRKQGKVFGS